MNKLQDPELRKIYKMVSGCVIGFGMGLIFGTIVGVLLRNI